MKIISMYNKKVSNGNQDVTIRRNSILFFFFRLPFSVRAPARRFITRPANQPANQP